MNKATKILLGVGTLIGGIGITSLLMRKEDDSYIFAIDGDLCSKESEHTLQEKLEDREKKYLYNEMKRATNTYRCKKKREALDIPFSENEWNEMPNALQRQISNQVKLIVDIYNKNNNL